MQASVLIGAILAAFQFFLLVQASQPSFLDCMKNPFAPGCRGISAKRSQGPLRERLSKPEVEGACPCATQRWPSAIKRQFGPSEEDKWAARQLAAGSSRQMPFELELDG